MKEQPSPCPRLATKGDMHCTTASHSPGVAWVWADTTGSKMLNKPQFVSEPAATGWLPLTLCKREAARLGCPRLQDDAPTPTSAARSGCAAGSRCGYS